MLTNTSHLTSYIFFVPAYLSFFLLPLKDVSIACLLCLTTSALHHGRNCQDKIIQKIDKIVVRSVAGVYVLHSLLTMPIKPPIILMYLLGIVATLIYAQTGRHQELYETYHHWIHILSNIGICCYILARYKYLDY
jgi:hypothetical protein